MPLQSSLFRITLAALVMGATSAAARAQAAPAPAASAADREAVRRAALDYLEGFYEGDSVKVNRSVWPEVRKWGYALRRRDGAATYEGMAMAFPGGFMSYVAAVQAGRVKTPANAPKEVTIFDVQDQTASVKVVAWWGIDYLLLARIDGRWMITHVLWQTPPAK